MMMRGLARKLAAVAVGFFGTWLTTLMTGLGYSAEDAAVALSSIEMLITLAIFGVFMFASEHLLKLVKPLFPGDWADEVWRSKAGDRVSDMTKDAAETRISQGDI